MVLYVYTCANCMQNARFKRMHAIEAQLCCHVVFRMSFRNIQRQKRLSQFFGWSIRTLAQYICHSLACISWIKCCDKLKLNFLSDSSKRFESPHDKTNKMTVHPAKTQISLGIRPVWSVFAVRTKIAWSLATHWAHSEDSDQTGRMPRLISVFPGCTVILLVLSWGSSFC